MGHWKGRWDAGRAAGETSSGTGPVDGAHESTQRGQVGGRGQRCARAQQRNRKGTQLIHLECAQNKSKLKVLTRRQIDWTGLYPSAAGGIQCPEQSISAVGRRPSRSCTSDAIACLST